MAAGSWVTVRLPQSLAEHAGGRREITVEAAPGATLADVLDALGTMAPGIDRRVRDETGAVRRFVNVYVDEDECRTLDGLRTPVPPGTVLFVIPSVAGGAA